MSQLLLHPHSLPEQPLTRGKQPPKLTSSDDVKDVEGLVTHFEKHWALSACPLSRYEAGVRCRSSC